MLKDQANSATMGLYIVIYSMSPGHIQPFECVIFSVLLIKILQAKRLDLKTLAPLCATLFQDPGISEFRYVHNRITVQGFS